MAILTRAFAARLTLLAAIYFAPSDTFAADPSAVHRTEAEKNEYHTAMLIADQKLAAEVESHSELVPNLEYLTTEIGARLTGSPQMQQASNWTLQRFRNYGIDAHLETTQVSHAWIRGIDRAEITAPVSRQIEIRSLAWSSPTDGVLTAKVITTDITTVGDIAKYKGELGGKIVMTAPARLRPSNEVPANSFDALAPPPLAAAQAGEAVAPLSELTKALADERPASILLDSGKVDSLFNMQSYNPFEPSAVPMAFLTHEDYLLLHRLAKNGPIQLKLSLNGSLSAAADASITVAEIKGNQFPDERVILGAHLDSWDLGQGALDNGTGAMAVLEAARAIKALNWKPKRTITFILFTGEEQGKVGAKLFLRNHADAVSKIDGVLIHDAGTGKVTSIALENLFSTDAAMLEVYQPLQETFGLEPLSTRYMGSSDHVPFLDAGVPAYLCIQELAHYGEAHHSQTDTFDKVIPDDINQGAAFLAAWAWNLSEMPDALPRQSNW